MNYLHLGDLPNDVRLEGDLAIDTETKGLNTFRDRLCLVQLSDGNGDSHLVKFKKDNYDAPNLKKLLAVADTVKIFHYGRFDIAAIKHYLGISIENIYCTKIASKLVRTYTDRHGLKDLCLELIGVELSKQQQCSNWAANKLSDKQVDYAASDVLYLHKLRDNLNAMLKDEGRCDLAKKCFDFLPTRVELDLKGWSETDIFHH